MRALVHVAVLTLPLAGAYSCNNTADCELLGACVDGRCDCLPGWTGPSCAQLDLVPSDMAPAWPPQAGRAFGPDPSRRAYGWGMTVAPAAAEGRQLLHAVQNVGCYDQAHMVTMTMLLHLTSASGPLGPWTAAGIVAPPTTFNPHLQLSPGGDFVLFFRANLAPPPSNWAELVCGGGATPAQWARLVAAGPYITEQAIWPNGSSTVMNGNLVARSKAMRGGAWEVRAFDVVGQEATCGNKSIISHNSNPSAVVLPSGTVVLAYRYTFARGSESVNVAVADSVWGPYEALFPCNYSMTSGTWGEDPFIFRSPRDGALHMYYHCMRYGHGLPNSPGLHAWSANGAGDGRGPWRTTLSPGHRGAYSTNVSLANGSSTGLLYHRRERPDILFDQEGAPLAFFSAVQETSTPQPQRHVAAGTGTGFGWSFGFAQAFNTTAANAK
eukprot:g2316.t1